MKKIILFTALCIVAVSCKKEEVAPVQPATQNVSMKQQVADLIQKADNDLYQQVYGQVRAERRPIVKGIPGIFFIPSGGIDEATCWPAFNVCMVVVISSRVAQQNVTGPEAGFFVNGDYNESFPQDVIAKLIINRSIPETRIINEIHATKDVDEIYHVQYN